LQIVDESDDYLVVEKPPFLLIHPSKPDGQLTLWSALRELFAFATPSHREGISRDRERMA
jgi:23S rRNA-/tRNA-specific pseudouridylate synthase